MNGSSFFVALLRAALVIFTAFFLGACVEEEKGGNNNNTGNNEANNTDNGDNNDGNNEVNNTENPVCDGKQDNANCPVNSECADTEFWHPQGECVEKCDYANCYVDEGQECDALTGNCFWPEIDPIENPCAEWAWLRPEERPWHCPKAREGDMGLRLEEQPDGCYMSSQTVLNRFKLPQETVIFYPEEEKFLVQSELGDFECFPMGQ